MRALLRDATQKKKESPTDALSMIRSDSNHFKEYLNYRELGMQKRVESAAFEKLVN